MPVGHRPEGSEFASGLAQEVMKLRAYARGS